MVTTAAAMDKYINFLSDRVFILFLFEKCCKVNQFRFSKLRDYLSLFYSSPFVHFQNKTYFCQLSSIIVVHIVIEGIIF